MHDRTAIAPQPEAAPAADLAPGRASALSRAIKRPDLPPASILALQHSAGNRAVVQALRPRLQRVAVVRIGEKTLTPDVVVAAVLPTIEEEYKASQVEKKEHGGWIFYNASTNEYKVVMQTTGRQESGIALKPWHERMKGNPPADAEFVGDFHTHPGYDVAASAPSADDVRNAMGTLHFSYVATHTKDPKSRDRTATPEFHVVGTSGDMRVFNIR